MARFEQAGASDYDARITKLIPGYQLLHQLVAEKIALELEDNAHILVVGAGTGSDILALNQVNPTWRYTAVDISKDMLDIATNRIELAGISQKVKFVVGEVKDLDNYQSFDAALCLFVLHFIKSLDNKFELLRNVKLRLKEQGVMLTADLMKKQQHYDNQLHSAMSKNQGLSEEKAKMMVKNLDSDFFSLNDAEFKSILLDAGFDNVSIFFQIGRFKAYQLESKKHGQKPNFHSSD